MGETSNNRSDKGAGHYHPSSAGDAAKDSGLQREQLAVFQTALRSSHVTVFSQDRALRYVVTSGPIFNHPADWLLGRADDDILPEGNRAHIIALKRDVLTAGEPRDAEVSVGEGTSICWYDLHLEPLRDRDGQIDGLTGVLVDITGRKQGEAHLRLLMRELTHRSKNLLAVIQAMARQTAAHVGSVDGFLHHFNGRVQGLAASHDLLVRESWYGASLRELVQAQLGPYLDGPTTQVNVEGPSVVLSPEAAQGLGLALHELLANAAQYGALSVPNGAVSISWNKDSTGEGLDVVWNEHAGPTVIPRRKRGFGTLVIEHNLVRALNAEVNWRFDPQGVRCEIGLPPAQVVSVQ